MILKMQTSVEKEPIERALTHHHRCVEDAGITW